MAGDADRQCGRIGQRRAARELRIAHAQIAGDIRRQPLLARILRCDMAGRMRGQSRLGEQEGEYQQEGVQGAAHEQDSSQTAGLYKHDRTIYKLDNPQGCGNAV